jgi:AbrB family looped-hinge helix DNA binding protein
MEIALTTMSSRGQVVIPAEMREDIAEGDRLLIIRDEGHFIMKKARELEQDLKGDLEFAKRTEAALRRYDQGKHRKMDLDRFMKHVHTW